MGTEKGQGEVLGSGASKRKVVSVNIVMLKGSCKHSNSLSAGRQPERGQHSSPQRCTELSPPSAFIPPTQHHNLRQRPTAERYHSSTWRCQYVVVRLYTTNLWSQWHCDETHNGCLDYFHMQCGKCSSWRWYFETHNSNLICQMWTHRHDTYM